MNSIFIDRPRFDVPYRKLRWFRRRVRLDCTEVDAERIMRLSWTEATEAAVRRLAAKSPQGTFTRQELIEAELDRIVSDTGSSGATPEMTLSREL